MLGTVLPPNLAGVAAQQASSHADCSSGCSGTLTIPECQEQWPPRTGTSITDLSWAWPKNLFEKHNHQKKWLQMMHFKSKYNRYCKWMLRVNWLVDEKLWISYEYIDIPTIPTANLEVSPLLPLLSSHGMMKHSEKGRRKNYDPIIFCSSHHSQVAEGAARPQLRLKIILIFFLKSLPESLYWKSESRYIKILVIVRLWITLIFVLLCSKFSIANTYGFSNAKEK